MDKNMSTEMLLNSIAELVYDAFGLEDAQFALIVFEKKENVYASKYIGTADPVITYSWLVDYFNEHNQNNDSRSATNRSAQ